MLKPETATQDIANPAPGDAFLMEVRAPRNWWQFWKPRVAVETKRYLVH